MRSSLRWLLQISHAPQPPLSSARRMRPNRFPRNAQGRKQGYGHGGPIFSIANRMGCSPREYITRITPSTGWVVGPAGGRDNRQAGWKIILGGGGHTKMGKTQEGHDLSSLYEGGPKRAGCPTLGLKGWV